MKRRTLMTALLGLFAAAGEPIPGEAGPGPGKTGPKGGKTPVELHKENPGLWREYRVPRLPAGKQPYRPYMLNPDQSGWLIEDVWPPLYFGHERVPEVKRKVAALPWAKQAWDWMREEAEMAMSAPPELPVEPAGWRHDFYSRATAFPLLHEPDRSDTFLDTLSGKRETGPKEHRAWTLLTHERTLRMMRSLGFLYAVTGEDRYARWTAEGMRRAAAYFTHDEFRNTKDDAFYYQPLYDAAVMLLLADAYDLTRDSPAYSAGDHDLVRQGIFEKRIPALIAFLDRGSAANMGAYASAAVVTAGRLLQRPDWVSRGMGGKNAWRELIRRDVPVLDGVVDGFWREGTLFYHFYTLFPFVTLFEAEKAAGAEPDPDVRRRFDAMFAAPLAMVDQQQRLPVIGDLGLPRYTPLAAYRHLYEYAAGQVDPAHYGPVLASIYANLKTPRTDLAALAWGPDTLPAPGGLPTGHTRLPVEDLVVFRSEQPQPFWLLFRGGRYRGGHDHPDKLSIFLHAFGEPISPDLGTPGYALRPFNHSYFRSTQAHNSLFADEQEQKGSAHLEWLPDAAPARARGVITEGGITFRRTVFFDPPYVALLDEYDSEAEHRFGWAYHAYGPVELAPAAAGGTPPSGTGVLMPPLPATGAWALFTHRRTAGAGEDGNQFEVRATWTVKPDLNLHLVSRSSTAFEVTAANAPGQPYPDRQSVLIYRAPGKSFRLCTVLEAGPGAPTVRNLAADADGTIRVGLPGGEERRYRY